jgi:hypothetical protein
VACAAGRCVGDAWTAQVCVCVCVCTCVYMCVCVCVLYKDGYKGSEWKWRALQGGVSVMRGLDRCECVCVCVLYHTSNINSRHRRGKQNIHTHIHMHTHSGWAKASAAAIDVANTAAELLDTEAGLSVPSSYGSGFGLTCTDLTDDEQDHVHTNDHDHNGRNAVHPSPCDLIDGLWLNDEEGVLVEAEGVPFALQPPVERAEFNS